MKLKDVRLTIIGLGLMGGSLARALGGKVASIHGVDLDPDSLEFARDHRIVDHASQEAAEGLRQCDLAILAVPVGEILQIIDQIGNDLPAPRYLMDLGSTKGAITEGMSLLPASVEAIGGHPLCGKETAGVRASEPTLFLHKNFVLTPLDRTSPPFLDLCKELVTAVGANPLILEPEEHDRAVALTSHLPYLISASLTQAVMEAEGSTADLRALIASGFIDTTRIAASEVQMISDVLLTNRANVLAGLERFSGAIDGLQNLLDVGDPAPLRQALSPILQWRQSLATDPSAPGERHGT
jgi:prephenate dehydrogenase